MVSDDLHQTGAMDVTNAFSDDGAGGDVSFNGHANHVTAIEFIGVHRAERVPGPRIVDGIPDVARCLDLLEARHPIFVFCRKTSQAHLCQARAYPVGVIKKPDCFFDVVSDWSCERDAVVHLVRVFPEGLEVLNPGKDGLNLSVRISSVKGLVDSFVKGIEMHGDEPANGCLHSLPRDFLVLQGNPT